MAMPIDLLRAANETLKTGIILMPVFNSQLYGDRVYTPN